MFIQGITVKLYDKTEDGFDNFGRPVFIEIAKEVENVLPIQPSTDEVVNELNLTGKKVEYKLCIPKGDTNIWENRKVEFFGEEFQTYGHIIQYVEKNTPTAWNKQIYVVRYE